LEEREESKSNIPEEIIQLANQRLQAKQEKNYELADKIRAEIQSK